MFLPKIFRNVTVSNFEKEKFEFSVILILIDKYKDHSHEFYDIVKGYNLNFAIKEPTRITKNDSSCIDNVITNICVRKFAISHDKIIFF